VCVTGRSKSDLVYTRVVYSVPEVHELVAQRWYRTHAADLVWIESPLLRSRVYYYRAGHLLKKATLNFCLKGCNSTGPIAMKTIIKQLINFSEGRYGLKATEFR